MVVVAAGASPSWPGSSAVCAQRQLGGTALRGEGRACRPPDPDPVTAQLPAHPVGAIGEPAGFPDLVDVGEQPEVDQIPVTGPLSPLDPLLEGRLGDVQDP